MRLVTERGHAEYLLDNFKKASTINPEHIPETYWKAQERILDQRLDNHDKESFVREIQRRQNESISAWVDYLSYQDCPYPIWFRIYALDGVRQMTSFFDRGSGRYRKRDKSSVAPYPHLDQAVLGKVYGAISDYFKTKAGREDWPEDDVRRLAESSNFNFNRLYSRLLLSKKHIPRTPERTEDVRGEWVEYGPGDEERIAAAAEGTPWCIATPSVVRRYLDSSNPESRAKFILFHLCDGDITAENASASVRLGPDGEVAEISGLLEDQALEDALVPIVEKKVRTLPGGERFLKELENKQRLIALYEKMQARLDISQEDFRFIHGLGRQIIQIDPRKVDPRIGELRLMYGPEYARAKCYIGPGTNISDIEENLSSYLKNDSTLKSNMLAYILKQTMQEEKVKGISSMAKFLSQMSAFSEAPSKKLFDIIERINNLEICETEHYTFLLPRDQWKKGKIELPNDLEGRFIAPANLTAILKKPVAYYGHNGETDWGKTVVYNESCVGKEIQHFPHTEELLNALEILGCSIPESWQPIVNGAKRQIAKEQGIDEKDVTDAQISEYLQTRLKMPLAGYMDHGIVKYSNSSVVGHCGCYWSKDVRYLYFNPGAMLLLKKRGDWSSGLSVRCLI